MEQMSFMQACNKFFGKRSDQGLKDFMEEVKQLTPKDRDDMRAELEAALGCKVS